MDLTTCQVAEMILHKWFSAAVSLRSGPHDPSVPPASQNCDSVYKPNDREAVSLQRRQEHIFGGQTASGAEQTSLFFGLWSRAFMTCHMWQAELGKLSCLNVLSWLNLTQRRRHLIPPAQLQPLSASWRPLSCFHFFLFVFITTWHLQSSY